MEVDDKQHETLRLVTAPSLTSVCLSPNTLPEDTLAWVANGMPEVAPNITHLGISLDWLQTIEISRHSALKHLELRSVAVKARFWESLASCKRLTKIVLMACTNVIVEWDEDFQSGWRLGIVHFPALHTLRIRYGLPRVLANLVSRSHMPMLECIRWDEYSRLAKYHVDQMAARLKLCSPKLNTDTLYRNATTAHSNNPLDSNDDSFGW